MNSSFDWEDELSELMQGYSAELPSLEDQVNGDLAEAHRRANGGIDLTPIFARSKASCIASLD